jgi:hypothetical protein
MTAAVLFPFPVHLSQDREELGGAAGRSRKNIEVHYNIDHFR